MAKGARASSKKANNSKLKGLVFGPVESARAERLSAKLLELASQPRPKKAIEDVVMDVEEEANNTVTLPESERPEAMDVDQDKKIVTGSKSTTKGRISKKRSSRSRKASIVFPRYKNGKKVSRSNWKK